MAPPRRRGRGAPPGGTLGTLVRGAMAQAGVMRDVLERSARDGKARLDDALRERRRRDALAELGERALAQLRAGTPEALLDDDHVAALVEQLDAFDQETDGASAGDTAGTAAAVASVARDMMTSLRARFDDREPGAGRRAHDDDGTVGSGAVWRGGTAAPTAGGIQFGDDDDDDDDAGPRGRTMAGAADDSDGDLADYMHPDDVPATSDRPRRDRNEP